MTPIIAIERLGRRSVRIRTKDGCVGDFRTEQAGLAFTSRVLGGFLIQQEFNLQLTTQPTTDKQSARGAGPGRNLTVSYDSDQDRRALSSQPSGKAQ